VSSNYTSAPDPAADGSNQVEVSRALKQTQEALILKVEELELAIDGLETSLSASAPTDATSIIVGSKSGVVGGGGINLNDPALDAVFTRAVEDSRIYIRQARTEARSALDALETALGNFKAEYDDTNAVVNATIYNLSSKVEENTASISVEELTRTTSAQALAGRVAKITSVVNSNTAEIVTEQVTRATADSALSAQITTISAQTGTNTAAITAEQIARTDADTALATSISTVSTQTGVNTAAITAEATARTTADSALTTQINSVEAKTDAGTASGFYRLTALSSPTDGAAAEFAVEVKASAGSAFVAAGMNIQAFSNGTRRIKMNTDQFIINSGGSNFTPFAVTSGQLIANALVAASNISGSISSGQVSGLGLMAMIDKISSLNIATYMEAGVIGTAYIGDAQITSAKISSLSANKISAGTISGVNLEIIAADGVSWILRANWNGSQGCDLWAPTIRHGFSYNLFNPSVPGFHASGIGEVGLLGSGTDNFSTTNHGVRGRHNSSGASGLVGTAAGYDFYAEGTGINYGPFTGAHDALANLDETFEVGDIVVDVECIVKRGVSNTLFRVEKSTSSAQKGVVGVVARLFGLLANSSPPAVFDQVPSYPAAVVNPDGSFTPSPPVPADNDLTPIWNTLKSQYNYMAINALGEGQLNVCGEGGDVSVGDLICASSIPGKGMKQSDDIVHSYTVARAREAVTFSSPTEIKFVPCIYLCG
jgi:hypothetical protein